MFSIGRSNLLFATERKINIIIIIIILFTLYYRNIKNGNVIRGEGGTKNKVPRLVNRALRLKTQMIRKPQRLKFSFRGQIKKDRKERVARTLRKRIIVLRRFVSASLYTYLYRAPPTYPR